MMLAAVAVLLMGAFSCTKKATPLEKLVKEISAELPVDDGEYDIVKVEYDGTNVVMTFDAKDGGEISDEMIDVINDFDKKSEEMGVTREALIEVLLEGYHDHDLMNYMLEEGAGMVMVFNSVDKSKSARVEITPAELAQSNEYYQMDQEEDLDLSDDLEALAE